MSEVDLFADMISRTLIRLERRYWGNGHEPSFTGLS